MSLPGFEPEYAGIHDLSITEAGRTIQAMLQAQINN